MFYLLRKTADGPNGLKTDLVAILSDQGTACYEARDWVGGDAVRESYSGGILRLSKPTDYGQRRATVQPLALDDTDKGLA